MQRIESFLRQYKILNSGNTFLVGFSGGYDSMCLLDILYALSSKFDFRIVAIHLNHNWRGEESEADEDNCKKFCEKKGIDFYSEKLASNVKKTETAAREARQDFFRKCCKKYNAAGVFLAHNKSDNTETVLYRITKGTGVLGLCGIALNNNNFGYEIYRPLLLWTRDEIERYCSENDLKPNIDSSNFDVKYKRNFLRHKVVNELKNINPYLDDTIFRLSRISESEQNIIKEYLNKIRSEISIGDKFITSAFTKLSTDIQKKFIHELLLSNGIDYDSEKIDELFNFINENAGLSSGKTISIAENLWLWVSAKDFCFINRPEKDMNILEVSGEGIFSFGDKKIEIKKLDKLPDVFPKETEDFAYVNLSFPISIRTRRDGDIIQPFGMQGTMKLKKYFINKNVEKYIRDNIVLLCKEKEILWVPKIGLSEKLRVKMAPLYIISMKER